MKLLEWIKQTGKKIIITDRLANALRLLRKANREVGIDTSEVSRKTLLKIAEELLLAKWAFEGEWNVPQILRAEAGVYIIDEILRGKKYGFVPKECYCIKTSEELWRNIHQIRMNETTMAYEEENGTKLSEMKDMIAVYIEELTKRNCMDEPMVLSVALAALDKMQGKEMLLYLPWIRDCQIGILEGMEFTSLEQAFVNKFLEIAGIKAEQLIFFEQDMTKEVEYQFFSAYGAANEVDYVTKQIIEGKLAYGDVNLFYTDAVYENFIKANFEKKGIPYAFLTGEKVASFDTIQFMVAIINWASSDYLYKKLKDVVENPLMSFANVAEDNEEAADLVKNPMTCYNHFLRKGIGWSKERYFECVRRVGKNEKERKKYQFFRDFLRELAEIFEVGLSCEMLYERLFDFTMKYTYSQNAERKVIKPVLEAQRMVFAQVASQESVEEMLHLMKERLLGLTVTGEEKASAVGIYKIQNTEILERPYNYFIGLSAKQFAADTTESPVLSDEELKKYLRGNIKLASEAGSRLREHLTNSIRTLTRGRIVMGYSTFDTVELKESSPSVFYLDYKDNKGAKEQAADYCGYEVMCDTLQVVSNATQTVTAEESYTDTASIEMSSSGLQTLNECPLRYYYHYIKMLPSIEFQEKKAHQWLTAAAKGNLFHRTMERYCEDVIMKSKHLAEEVNEQVFEEIFEAAVTEMLEELPYVSEIVFKQEKETERNVAWNYLCEFQKALYDDAKEGIFWKVLGCELGFEKVSYKVPDTEQTGKVFEILFNGSIDRLDGYVKDGVLYLRIVDYKTGKVDKKKKEIDKNKQLQHFVYAMAATVYATKKKTELAALFGEEIKDIAICSVQYVFPNEGVLDATAKVKESVVQKEYRLPQEVDEVIWGLLGNMYCVEEEQAQDYMTEFAIQMETDSKGKPKKNGPEECWYCKYVRQCRRKIGTEL